MNFLRIKLVFCLLMWQSLLFAQGDNLAAILSECSGTPRKVTADTQESAHVSLDSNTFNKLYSFVDLTHNTLQKLLSSNIEDSSYHLPAQQLLKVICSYKRHSSHN